MPQAYLEIAPELIVSLVTAIQEPRRKFAWEVVENILPADTKFIRAEPQIGSVYGGRDIRLIRVVLESASFKDGETLSPPVLQAVPIVG